MSATTSPQATAEFADLLTSLADDAGADVFVDPAEDRGWMTRAGEALLVTDADGGQYLVTVQEVS